MKALTSLALAASLVGISALPAQASQQKNLRACKAEITTGGHLANVESVKFVRAKRSDITVEVTTADGTEREAVCKLRRGKIVSLDMDGKSLALNADATTEVR